MLYEKEGVNQSDQSTNSSIASERFNDLRYLEAVEIEYFLKLLLKEVILISPDDHLAFSATFFRRLRTCQYILGKDLSFIRESHYNRLSFVFCCRDAFSGFSDVKEMSLYEFACFLDLAFPGFNEKSLEEFATVLEPMVQTPTSKTYDFQHLQQSLYFWIVYEKWLHELSGLCKGVDISIDIKATRKVANLATLLKWVNSERYDITLSPSKDLVVKIFTEIFERQVEPEISFDRLKQYLFLNSSLHSDLLSKLPKTPISPANITK